MTHWLLEHMEDSRKRALKLASRMQIYRELFDEPVDDGEELVRRFAEVLEMAVLDLLLENTLDDVEKHNELKNAAADAFRLLRALPRPADALEAGYFF